MRLAVVSAGHGPDPEGERRYSPATCIGTDTRIVQRFPDPAKISLEGDVAEAGAAGQVPN